MRMTANCCAFLLSVVSIAIFSGTVFAEGQPSGISSRIPVVFNPADFCPSGRLCDAPTATGNEEAAALLRSLEEHNVPHDVVPISELNPSSISSGAIFLVAKCARGRPTIPALVPELTSLASKWTSEKKSSDGVVLLQPCRQSVDPIDPFYPDNEAIETSVVLRVRNGGVVERKDVERFMKVPTMRAALDRARNDERQRKEAADTAEEGQANEQPLGTEPESHKGSTAPSAANQSLIDGNKTSCSMTTTSPRPLWPSLMFEDPLSIRDMAMGYALGLLTAIPLLLWCGGRLLNQATGSITDKLQTMTDALIASRDDGKKLN